MGKRSVDDQENESQEEALSSILLMMDDYAPIIPDRVTDYYLAQGGLETDDIRILLALATQKFISDVCADAMQFAKVRQQAAAKDKKNIRPDKRIVLTMDDLSQAVQEHGVSIRKPDYYQ